MALEAGTVTIAVEADMSHFGDSAAEGIQQATSGAGSKLSESRSVFEAARFLDFPPQLSFVERHFSSA